MIRRNHDPHPHPALVIQMQQAQIQLCALNLQPLAARSTQHQHNSRELAYEAKPPACAPALIADLRH